MAEQNRLLYDSTPEKSRRTQKVSDKTPDRGKTTAWHENETELQDVKKNPESTAGETSETAFVSDISPVHSSPGRSDKELLKVHKATPIRGSRASLQKLPSTPEKNKVPVEPVKHQKEPGSGRQSEISSLRSVTPHSDSKSYRERIKERVAAAKERALATGQVKSHQQRGKSPSISRSEDLDKEDEEVEEAMRRHRAVRTRWKTAATSAQVANIQSGYDFFSKSWEEPTTPPLKTRTLLSEEEKGSQKGDESEDEKLLCAEVLGSREDDWLPLFNHEPPALTDFSLLEQKQIGIFFCPSTSPVPIEEKLEPNTIPRFLEEEGLYVGKTVKIPWKRLNKIEQRIMAMGSERFWFGEDGELKGTPDPLDYSRFRLNFDEVIDAALVEYKQAVIECKESRALDVSSDTPHILEIDLGKIHFEHHPLFSEEEIQSTKLTTMLNAVNSIPSDRLGRRLAALRNSAKAGGESNRRKLRKEIRETRTRWLAEKKKERELTESILETWRDLKTLRKNQGFAITSFRLIIATREQLPHELEWDAQVDMYLEELEEDAEEEYFHRIEVYNKKLDDWNNQIEKQSADTGDETAEEGSKEQLPERPRRPSKQKMKNRILEELVLSLRPPDEPIIEFELVSDVETPITVNDKLEQDRRNALRKSQIWVILRHNEKEVDRVKALQEPNFSFQLSFRFCLRLTQWPKSLGLRLVDEGQSSMFGKKPIAEIFLPIPGRISTESADWHNFEFSCGHITGELPHAGVGTTVRQLTSGRITVRMGWSEPLPNILQPLRCFKEAAKSKRDDIEKLKEWADQVQLDPNDPTNADLLEYIRSREERLGSESTLDKRGESCLDLCTEEDICENPRLKLLLLRQAGQPEFRLMRKVPLNDREIPKDIFKMYQKRTGGRTKKKGKNYGLDEVREQGREFLDQLREDVTKIWRQEHNKSFREMVHEEPVPDLWTLGLTFMKWLQPKRPLRPKRKGRKKLPVKSLVGQQLEIMVNIGRAFEVPVRKEEDNKISEEGFQVVAVRPFVEVTFQDQRRRTPTGEGPNPTWNQDLHIPVHCPGGVQSVKDSLHFHLYDETLVDLVEDDRLRETNIHQRMGRYWLGSLRIPFSALYQSSRIEGTFQLYSPPVLLGYNRESKEFRNSTFLSIFVMVHPPLNPPAPLQEKLETKEDAYLDLHLEQWSLEVGKSFPTRRAPTLVTDVTGKSVCITRFLRPIKPPEIVEGEATTAEMAARFVSMIPVSQSQNMFSGLLDIWMTADQILEHCITPAYCQASLLACFLMAIDEVEVRLLFGTGVPGGACVYVITNNNKIKEILIWDPSTGKKYAYADPFCPLSRVHTIMDQSNIWMNCQKEELVSQISLDVSKRYDWWPAFGRSISVPAESVQPESVNYVATSEVEVRRLQDKLEKLLRNALMKLRQANRTVWNRYVQTSLRKLLPGLEKSSWSGVMGSPPDHIQELQHILSSYKMCGFPINMPYTTQTALVEAVKSTGVHMNDAPEIEFSVAVYVHPFPSNILSVWVYVASLIRRR